MPLSEPNLHVRPLDSSSFDEVARLLGRGMVDNPVHLSVYGGDDSRRARRHERTMRALLAAKPSLSIEGVEQGGSLVGVSASSSPGGCRLSPGQQMRMLGVAASFGPRTAARLLSWKREWARHDLEDPHIHLGPVAVDRDLRGRGIGSLLLMRHAARLDAMGVVGYLETDRPEAIGFYHRFGYGVVGEAEVLGVPTWFMRRPAV